MEDSAPAPSRPRWVIYIPPALLLAVWLMQVVLTQTHTLTPWKGGGFGMFSVVTDWSLEISATDAEGRTLQVDAHSLLDRNYRLYQRLMAMPSDDMLCRAADTIAAGALQVVPFDKSPSVGSHQRA